MIAEQTENLKLIMGILKKQIDQTRALIQRIEDWTEHASRILEKDSTTKGE